MERESTKVYPTREELLFKLVIIGDFGVGKTSIIKRYAEGTYKGIYKITIGADFALKRITWNAYTEIALQLWDIAGHERFGSLTSVYYRYAVGAAIVFDLTRPETFKSVEKWLTDLRDKTSLPNGQPLPIILLANKGDVNTANVPSDIVEFCRQHQILGWFVTSAKNNTNIDDAMFFLVKNVLGNYRSERIFSSNYPLALHEIPKRKRHRCCY